MQTYNYIYSADTLENLINFSLFKNEKNILIQIFCGQERNVLAEIIRELQEELPQAICIGATTDGEISNSSITTLKTVISISTFDNTQIKTHYIEEEDSFDCGFALAKELVTLDTKLLILFSDGTDMNAEEFLKGVEAYDNSVVICGGMAGDNGKFQKTYIFSQNKIFSKGAVGVSLNSDTLEVATDYKFDWKAIGLEHTIDVVKGNRVFQIDGMKPMEFYLKYLGNDISKIEFPLIKQKNNIPIARAVIAKHEDGSVSFSGNFEEGEKVKIGFGDARSLLKNPIKVLTKLKKVKAQSFFIYSCMARRRYMPDLIKLQVEPFAQIAPTAGFFTYSEFYHHGKSNEVLNQTLTAVALSEINEKSSKKPVEKVRQQINKEEASYVKTIQSLTNLIQQSSDDYVKQSKQLEEQMNYSKNILHSHRQFLRHTIHEMNLPLSVIMHNIELHELEHGKSIYLENIEVGVKSIFSLYDDLSYLVRKDQLSYFKRDIDVVDYIRSRVDFFSQVALKAKSKLTMHSELDEAFIYFNETKLQRIVDNNITNAIKYTLEDENIDIYINSKNSKILFSISSHSRKIQKPEMVFEEYYREEKSKDGFGLGLNLVKRICVEEDINIELFSDEELTTFTYHFKGGRE